MDRYPLLYKVKKKKWNEELLNNEKVKTLFEKLANEASRENIPLTSITGHENVILVCAELEHINARFGKGETFLHWAASYEPAYAIDTTKVLVLLLLGADPNIQDDLGRTPLHWAINHDCSDIAEDHELHYERTSKANAIKVVYRLLSFNASPDIVDVYGASPFCHAVWSKAFHIADILRPFTSEHLQRPPDFILEENDNKKSIRCSRVDEWIGENASNVTENEERLQRLLSAPGIGLLQHQKEVEQQKEQVMTLFKRLSARIEKEDHLLEFIPTLAGSMAEGTKCQKPDEQDVILRLIKFEDVCIPEESEYAPDGVITLKFTGDENKANEYQQYILDGYLNREEILYSLITKLEREMSLMSNWSGKEYLNIYPSHYPTAELKRAISVGDIGNLTFIWHGQFYKQINLSIDIVPAIIVRNWRPENARAVDPTGGAVPNETVLILRAFIESFEYNLEIYGELNDPSETTGMEPANLEILNGNGWDSGSDCMSDKSDDENEKEPVNSTSCFYNAYLVRNIREDTGYSIPTIKRLLRQCDATLTGRPEPDKKRKTADDDFVILHPCKKPRKPKESIEKDSVAPDKTEDKEYKDVLKQSSPRTYDNSMPSTSTEYASYCNENSFHDRTNKSEGDNESFDIEANAEDTDTCNITILKDGDRMEKNCSRSGASEDNKYQSTSSEFGNVKSGEVLEDNKDQLISTEIGNIKDGEALEDNKDQSTTSSEFENVKCSETFDEDFIRNLLLKSVGSDIEGYEEFASILDTQQHYSFSELTSKYDENDEDDTDSDDLDDDPPREDMGFKISFSKWENETMATFPSSIKIAYMLSKILVSFVPRIRYPLNRGVSNSQGYSSVKDLFSYLLKMALFHAIRKHGDHITNKLTLREQEDQSKTSTSGNDSSCIEQIIYSRTKDHCSCEMRQSTMHSFNSKEIHGVAFLVDKLFSEIETGAEKGYLGAYFDEKFNILDRISTAGKQKGSPYPALLHLRKHCKMIRALVQVEGQSTNEQHQKLEN